MLGPNFVNPEEEIRERHPSSADSSAVSKKAEEDRGSGGYHPRTGGINKIRPLDLHEDGYTGAHILFEKNIKSS